jgi:hypothetical protein
MFLKLASTHGKIAFNTVLVLETENTIKEPVID